MAKFKIKNKSGIFSCPAILPYSHTVILSVCHSICLAHRISSYLPGWLFDILLTFWTTFVLIPKLKSLSVCLSFYLSVCQSVCLSIFLTSCWHSEQLLFWHESWKKIAPPLRPLTYRAAGQPLICKYNTIWLILLQPPGEAGPGGGRPIRPGPQRQGPRQQTALRHHSITLRLDTRTNLLDTLRNRNA